MQSTVVKGVGKCPKLPWMIEFHSTADGKVLKNQLEAAFADNQLLYMSKLHEKSTVRRKRLTQFSVILPPRVSAEAIESFLKAGMTMALLKADYFTIEQMQTLISQLREVTEQFGQKLGRVFPLAVGLDVPEPELVTGKLQKPLTQVDLQKGQTIKVSGNQKFANIVNNDYLYINYEKISNVVKPGDSIILGLDEIHMSAVAIVEDIVNCIVEKSGQLTDNLSVKIPNVPLIPDAASTKRLKAIGEKISIDIVLVGPGKIEAAKQVFGSSVLVFAKMEYKSTIKFFDDVVDKADGVFIDGDKLLTSSKENYFILQKSIIANCNKLAKPVIAAINCNSITKAQVNDIANTVIDGVDGLLLPPDSELMETISLICKAGEGAVYQKQLFDDLVALRKPPIEPLISVSIAAVEASFKSNAAAIILLTTSGRSAKLISMFRPRCPIIALTRFGRIAKQLMVYKAVIPIFYVQKDNVSFHENVEKLMQLGMTFGKINGYIKMGDAVVIVSGSKNNVGFRNCLEVVYASEYDTIPETDDKK